MSRCFSELQNGFRSPKRNPSLVHGKSSWYHYYAGFSPDFVKDAMKYLNLTSDAIVMDPWNGSGTTTQIARDMGFSTIGYDINPVMVLIAKAKMIDYGAKRHILDHLGSIIKTARKHTISPFLEVEPLEIWLTPESASVFRNLERAAQEMLIDNEYRIIYYEESLANMPCLAALFYTALFRTLREIHSPFYTSNPTWIKTPTQNERLHFSADQIYAMLKDQVFAMIEAITPPNRAIEYNKFVDFQIERASSDSIPLQDHSIDAVVSSPPYCTRIDYAIATMPELALLGCSMDKGIKSLRDRMIGTPTISETIPQVRSVYGSICVAFLDAVAAHHSKASKSYYIKYYLQYFDSIYRSLIEIDRTLAESGRCILVVQDSYYKDIHNDLPRIFMEMAHSLGWNCLDQFDFITKRTMAGLNRRTKIYRHSSTATESVLIFQKTS